MNLFKLGKREAKLDRRTLRLADYLPKKLPHPLLRVNWINGVTNYGMMGNDRLGDCTCAAMGHMLQLWSFKETGRQITVSDDAVISAYSAISGYDPQTGANDNGAFVLDVMNYWRKTGIDGHRIEVFVSVDPWNRTMVKQGIRLFGCLDTGIALPTSAQGQDVWDVPSGGATGVGVPGSWGGHSVPVVAYDAKTLTCVTWGRLQKMTWAFWEAYCDEAYAALAPEWTAKADTNPVGFKLEELRHDLRLLTA